VRRRNTPNASTGRGLGDVLGILLISASILLLAALFSYDPGDVPRSGTDVNPEAHNWIGRAGAWTAYGLFFILGGGSFLLPILLFLFGLSYLFQLMAYFHRRWVWAVVLMVVCMAWLDLYGEAAFLRQLHHNINGPPGGWVGMVLNGYVFDHFGTLGASILFLTLYLISLIYLTNFELGAWLRAWWERRRADLDPVSLSEQQLERRARELKRQARQLERRLNRDQATSDSVEEASASLGADLQPVPEPQVRDLSVPAERSDEEKERGPDLSHVTEGEDERPEETEAPAALEEEVQEEETIEPEPVVGPATTDEVLGRDTEPELVETDEATSEPESEPEPPPPPPPAPPRPAPRPKPPARKPRPIVVAAAPKIGNYQLPSMDLLNAPEPAVRHSDSKDELMANARLMQSTLGQFGIEVQLGDITRGPTITRYELHPAPGVKLERITGLSNNIAAALKAERIHILAPVPGKSSVGVEVPNPVKTKVIMRDLLEAPEWKSTRSRVPLALGKDVYGHPILADLGEMPHLLIAGSTGSGKSVCINSIITSLLYRFPPDQLRFVMIDPKVVELQQYNTLPHLVVPVVTDPKKVVLALRWVVSEMEKRYQIFARVGVRNIKSFNDRPRNKPLPQQEPELPLRARREKIEAGTDGFAVEVDEEIVIPRDDDIVVPEKLSYIVVIIDELADLMLVAPADVEMAIARITQMARAAGIHVIVATQRPSVDVITGVIKANIPARIAFQVASKVDSRTILDAMGADKLLGKGDMLYLPPGSAKLIRAQGALITDQEINALVEFISKQGKPSYEAEIHHQLSRPGSHYESDAGSHQDEDLIEQCIEIIRSEQKASVSLLQRRLRLGYTRAARIMDELEDRGIVGPSKGAEPRDILIDLDGTGADGGGQHGL
jgi:S-DNA-T family DNA segregation ATPase FtsK/SpoIIIE